MTKIIYLDTNVYLDLYFGRKGSLTTLRIFKRTLGCEFKIVFSDWNMYEITKSGVDLKELRIFFDSIDKRGKMIKVYRAENDVQEAKKISPEHFQDPLHAILAKKGGAELLITSDANGFNNCKHLVQTQLPENI